MVDQNQTSNSSCSEIESNIKIGTRIECLSQYGTVKYIGEVAGHIGTWLGIDWDDVSRGKHDGSVDGHHYFQASSSSSGSFIRPGKVKLGVDAITAITSRYGKKEDKTEQLRNKKELLDLQREMNAPFLTLVGFEKVNEKQSNFQDLGVISLRLQLVNGPGPEGRFLEMCPNITELDLSKNLLTKWTDVFSICEQLHNLDWLNLSENNLIMPENTEEISFPSIKKLICGFMKLNWSDVIKISTIFPMVDELRVPFNLITNIDIPSNHNLNNLQLLDLEGNKLKEWSVINKLGVLVNLEQLIITNTAIKVIKIEPINDLQLFPQLKQLVISENLINNWESISELNKLKNLEGLRFLKNPVLDTENLATCYQLIIARIATLNILNGTIIKSEDRRGAEYDYIKKYGKEWLTVKNDEQLKTIFLEKHPRYVEIITKYGEAEEAELATRAPSLKSSLTTVEIHNDTKIITKRLPVTMTVQKLIMLVQKLFNLPERPVLIYRSAQQPDMMVEFDDEFKEIGYYSIQDGDKIYVS